MKRYELKFSSGQTLLLYKRSKEEINTELYEKDLGKLESINLYEDTAHEEYIELIKQQCKFVTNTKHREIYEAKYYKGHMFILLFKDLEDGHYYDYAEYSEHIDNRILQPITRTMSTPKKVCELLSIKGIKYEVISHRYYGEPKLSKPKELKGIKPIGKVTYIPKHSEPQIFIKGKDVYIKHTDYFSPEWRPPKGERIGMPLSYYTEKYFNRTKSEKFIYPDCWGSIVLRNEAWIVIKDLIPLIETENEYIVAKNILKEQSKDEYSPRDIESDLDWVRFWEDMSKVVKRYIEGRRNKNE